MLVGLRWCGRWFSVAVVVVDDDDDDKWWSGSLRFPMQFLCSFFLFDGVTNVDRPCCGCAWINWWNVSKSQRNLRCGDGRWSWRNRRWIRVTTFFVFVSWQKNKNEGAADFDQLRFESEVKASFKYHVCFFGTATYSYYSCRTNADRSIWYGDSKKEHE